jgi:ferredoxin
MDRVIIVGGGFTARMILDALYSLRQDIHIQMIFPKEPLESNNSLYSETTPFRKNVSSERFKQYDNPSLGPTTYHFSKGFNPVFGFLPHGLTSVWGAQVEGLPDRTYFFRNGFSQAFYEQVQVEFMLIADHLRKLGFLNETDHERLTKFYSDYNCSFDESVILVNRESCISCARCHSGCQKNALYSADNDFENLKGQSIPNLTITRAAVKSVSELPKGVGVVVGQPGGMSDVEYTADFCFLASGPIETTRLYLQSRFPKKFEVEFSSSDGCRGVGFKLFRFGPREISLTTSRYIMRQLSASGRRYNVSVYDVTNDLLAAAGVKLPRVLTRILSYFLFVIQVRTEPTELSNFKMLLNDGAFFITSTKQSPHKMAIFEKFLIFSDLFRPMLNVGIVLLPFFMTIKPGRAAHYGSSLRLAEGGSSGRLTITVNSGVVGCNRTEHLNRVIPCDASILPEVFPGSLTLTSSAFSRAVVKRVLRNKGKGQS